MNVQPISNLNAVTLIDQGIPQNIIGFSHVTGAVHIYVRVALVEFAFNLYSGYNLSHVLQEAQKMVNDAKATLRNALTENNIQMPSIDINYFKEDRISIGNGSAIK